MDHIVAKITFSADVPDPKTRGVKTGYAPHHKFARVDYLVSGFHTYSDQNTHYPGETICAKISFPSWEFIRSEIKVGDSFEILELKRLIGFGVVESVIG